MDDLATRALRALAVGPYLMLCEYPGDFTPLHARAQSAATFGAHQMSTWRPANALAFTVVCMRSQSGPGAVQLLYDHATSAVYYLRREAWLPKCAPGTSILAHFVEDSVAGNTHPRLLLFDLLRDAGTCLRDVCPSERYARLRAAAEVRPPRMPDVCPPAADHDARRASTTAS